MICKELIYLHAFFVSKTFISNTKLKMAENQENAKQNPEAELLLFKSYLHSSSTLPHLNSSTDPQCSRRKLCESGKI